MREIICFHNPDEVNGYLSNWYLSDFRIGNTCFSSMEQYMMHQKALFFMMQQLLATQNSILAECAVQDKIWGIGLSMKDEKRYDINEWKGQNLLGFSLMHARTELENGGYCLDHGR